MSGPTVDDEARWVQAQKLLDRTSPEPPHRQAARERYDRRAARAAVVLVGAALTAALVALAVDPPPEPSVGPPTWRLVTGLAVAVLGFLLALIGPAARPFGSQPGLGRPLGVLTREQRAALTQQVRGRAPLVRDRIDLARSAARQLLEQRSRLLLQSGLMTAALGMWIVQRTVVQTLMTLAFLTMTAAIAVPVLRDARHARRFLTAHPPPAGDQ